LVRTGQKLGEKPFVQQTRRTPRKVKKLNARPAVRVSPSHSPGNFDVQPWPQQIEPNMHGLLGTQRRHCLHRHSTKGEVADHASVGVVNIGVSDGVNVETILTAPAASRILHGRGSPGRD
jgi:hypothetical protein